ncbi:MAG: DNA-binding response regulator, partial [Elusimicrobia bacterium]|nr:DNA-binding response regulator [Elusimicrobiota bacterium]
IPVVMLTAMDQGKDVEKAVAYGADAYIPKPIDFPKLRAKIAQFVKLPPPAAEGR